MATCQVANLRRSAWDKSGQPLLRNPYSEPGREAMIESLTDMSKANARRALQQGRAALRSGNRTAAISWHKKAVDANVQYERGEYSPRDLALELQRAGVSARQIAMVPSERKSTFSSTPNDFGRSPADAYRPIGAERSPSKGFGAFGATKSPAAPASSGQDLLRSARQALARGNGSEAMRFVEQANRSGSRFALHGDSPQKVEADIRRNSQFAAGPAPGTNPATYRRQYATSLMDQAQALMKHGDFATAQQLAQKANSLGAQFRDFERTPKDLLDSIVTAQESTSRPATLSAPQAPAGALQATIGDGLPQDVQRLPSASPNGNSRKAQASQLLASARVALGRGDVALAERLVSQAEGLGVPQSEFGMNEVKPWQLGLEIRQAKSRSRAVRPAGYEEQVAGGSVTIGDRYPVSRGVYEPSRDGTRNQQAQAVQSQPTPAARLRDNRGSNSPGQRLYQQGS